MVLLWSFTMSLRVSRHWQQLGDSPSEHAEYVFDTVLRHPLLSRCFFTVLSLNGLHRHTNMFGALLVQVILIYTVNVVRALCDCKSFSILFVKSPVCSPGFVTGVFIVRVLVLSASVERAL